jgi:hypothetical protein
MPVQADEKREKAAVQAAGDWLKLVDGNSYGESWKTASSLFKNAVSMEQWHQSMKAFRKPLGKVLRRELKSRKYMLSLPGAPDGEYVVIQYESSFEHKRSAIETITPMLDSDGKWRVSGYYIK